MAELVERLAQPQEIAVAIRPAATPVSVRSAIERGFLPVRFTKTRGGTEVGVKVDTQRSIWSHADFDNGTGKIQLVGELTLDYTRARFHGTIDLAEMMGTGYLEEILPAPKSENTAV